MRVHVTYHIVAIQVSAKQGVCDTGQQQQGEGEEDAGGRAAAEECHECMAGKCIRV